MSPCSIAEKYGDARRVPRVCASNSNLKRHHFAFTMKAETTGGPAASKLKQAGKFPLVLFLAKRYREPVVPT
jgi:hypothetical protein